jgi:hypothetical protein
MTRNLIASSLQARISAPPPRRRTPPIRTGLTLRRFTCVPLSTNTRGPVARLLPPAPPRPQKGLKR